MIPLGATALFFEIRNAIRTVHNFYILSTTILGTGSYFMDIVFMERYFKKEQKWTKNNYLNAKLRRMPK